MHLLKRLLIGGLIASMFPYALSALYSIYLTVRYYDHEHMSQARLEHLYNAHFPGKVIYWLGCHMTALWASPLIMLKRALKRKTREVRKVEFRKIPVYPLPPDLSASLQEFMRSSDYHFDREAFFRP